MISETLHYSDLPIFDPDYGVKMLGNESVAKEILNTVIEQFPAEMVKIHDAYNSQDWLRLESLVHKLHGALAYCGVPRLKAATSSLEEHIRKDTPQNIMEIARSFHAFQNEVDLVLKNFIIS